MPNGKTTYKTGFGLVLSLILFGFIVYYAIIRFDHVKSDPVLIESVEYDFFDSKSIWSSEE